MAQVKKAMGRSKTPTLSVEDQDKIINESQKQDKKNKIQRITVDFPLYLYDKTKDYTDETGQSMRNFVVGLVRQFFENRDSTPR